MWSTSEIKARGKEAFKLNYLKCVVVSFLLGLTVSSTSSISVNQTKDNPEIQQAMQQMMNTYEGLTPGQQFALIAAIAGGLTLVIVISVALRIFLFNPLKVGCYAFFKQNDINPPAGFDEINNGFKNYMHIFVTLLLNDLFLTLWTMLFIIPGLIKSYSYRMVPYIIEDEPDLSPTETITRSRQMMDGHKWHAFCYDLSFIGWIILTVLTCGLVGLFWYGPYKNSSDAALYLALRGEEQPYLDDVQPVYPQEPAPVYPQEAEPMEAEVVEPEEAEAVDEAGTEEAEPVDAEIVEPAEAVEEAAEEAQPAEAEDVQPAETEGDQPTEAE